MNNHPTPPQQRHGHAAGHHPVLHPPFISNSLAIRQEIQRFESVHPSIYAIYDLIDLLPDAQIAQQIRDHVVCIEGMSRSIASSIVDYIEVIREQMPCGFKKYGIPPLAPLKIGHKEVGIHTYSVNVDGEVNQATVSGLNEFEVTVMKVNVILSKVNFEFVWNAVTIESLYDLEAILKSWGITVDVVGKGDMLLSVVNIKVKGTVKYSLGLIGSGLKLKEFKIVVTIGEANSNINGILGSGFVNHKLNEIIEEIIMMSVNDNQAEITNKIESFVLPTVNDAVDGKTIADIVSSIAGGGGETTKCEPSRK